MNVKHSCLSVEHYTPPDYKLLSSLTMGGTCLDPSSSELGQLLGAAGFFYEEKDDGLKMPWFGNVFVNPPGGMRDGSSNMRLWFQKALNEWLAGRIRQCIFLGFQLSVLRLNPEIIEMDLPFVIPRQRIRFWCSPEALLFAEISKILGKEAAKPFVATVSSNWVDWSLAELNSWGGDNFGRLHSHIAKCRESGHWVEGEPGQRLLPSRAPSHDNAVIYLPDREDPFSSKRFHTVFSHFGAVPKRYE